jgi:MYXO-CTERM domain-containing protein
MCASIPDAGMSGDAAADASTDDNVDAGNDDGGEEDATVDSSVSPTDSGEVADSGASTPGAEGQSTSPGDNGLSMRGGGCNCATAGGTSPVSGLSGLGAGLALAIAGMRRRASRRERHEKNHELQRRGEG